MINKPSRSAARVKRHRRMRGRLSGSPERPRLAVFRSNKHIYAQVIDDAAGVTIAAASTMEKDIRSALKSSSDVEAAKAVGAAIARKAAEKGVSIVVFDRGGHIYHGRVKALADAARQTGLQF
ncbi:MAG: 50S ribosomal protein L18 [Clostridiales bacterium]|nr:50S ribosomal protein L18 [Clostridiales bacterium]